MNESIVTNFNAPIFTFWDNVWITLNFILMLGGSVLIIMFLVYGIKAFKRSKDISIKLDKIINLMEKEK